MCGIGLTLFPTNDTQCPPFSPTATTEDSSSSSSSGSSVNLSCQCCHDEMQCRNYSGRILHESLSSRGPDYQSNLTFQHERYIPSSSSSLSSSSSSGGGSGSGALWDMNLYASVLHMRGKELIRQPYKSCSKNMERCYYLCWNGECYSHDAMYGQAFFDIGGGEESKSRGSISSSSSSSSSGKETTSCSSVGYDIDNDENVNDRHGNNNMSDTVIVMNLIQQAIEEEVDPGTGEEDVLSHDHHEHERICSVMGKIYGEYSFLLYCPDSGNDVSTHTGGVIYFGRDPLGRRSLVMGTNANTNINQSHASKDNPIRLNSLILSSVVPQRMGVAQSDTKAGVLDDHDFAFQELRAGRVYRLDIATGELSFLPILVASSSLSSSLPSSRIQQQPLSSSSWIMKEENEYELDVSHEILQAAEGLYQHLNHAVRRRVIGAPTAVLTSSEDTIHNHHRHNNHQKPASAAVLFSGGVDSVVLAALCHNHVPLDQPIDLINVAFAASSENRHENDDPFSLSPDRQAALLSYQEMKCQWPNRHWRFIAVNVNYDTVLEMEDTICKLISPLTSTMDFNIGTAMWFASRGLGEIVDCEDLQENEWKPELLKTSKHLRFCEQSTTCASSYNGKGKTTGNISSHGQCTTRGCSRRLSGRENSCRFGLCKVCCASIVQKRINQYLGGRADLCDYHTEMANTIKNKSKKKKSNVQKDTTKSKEGNKQPGKQQTIAPASTTDREPDTHAQKQNKFLYQSRAKVVIVGIGADEQMAGYGRHRVMYNKGGYELLRQELAMEKSRLWTRNLGRDDRCISSHGKEARFPFLDDSVTAYLNSLDVSEMVDMTKPQGMGDKMILRLVARRLGVTQCSGLVKRAIQFGSRIAKCSEVDRFGSSRNASGSAKHIRISSSSDPP